MKNYYDQKVELNIAKLRYNTLKEKKKIYFNMTQPGTMNYSKENVDGGVYKDTLTNYVIKTEKIDSDIEMVKKEIKTLEKNIRIMEKCLKTLKSPLEKVFVARYIDDLSVEDIADKLKYSPSHIYRELQIIKKIIEGDSNGKKEKKN